MAYMNSEKKAKIAPAVKAICQKYGIKGTLRVRDHSTLILTLSEGGIDFLKGAHESAIKSGHVQINVHWFKDHYTGRALSFLTEAYQAMMNGNHDRSDLMTDYFDVGWYVEIHVGRWDKPYKLQA